MGRAASERRGDGAGDEAEPAAAGVAVVADLRGSADGRAGGSGDEVEPGSAAGAGAGDRGAGAAGCRERGSVSESEYERVVHAFALAFGCVRAGCAVGRDRRGERGWGDGDGI